MRSQSDAQRRGERWGWTGGWLGGLGWILLLSIVFLAQGHWLEGATGVALFALGVAMTLGFAPWRHPRTRYWKLLIPLYVVLLAGIGWTIWAFGSEQAAELRWWHAFMLAPLLGPFASIGWRRWEP